MHAVAFLLQGIRELYERPVTLRLLFAAFVQDPDTLVCTHQKRKGKIPLYILFMSSERDIRIKSLSKNRYNN
jgi:hypothetical protein